MGRKKKFIDKRHAESFRVVHRSQRDPLALDENVSQRVLDPVISGNVKRYRESQYDASSRRSAISDDDGRLSFAELLSEADNRERDRLGKRDARFDDVVEGEELEGSSGKQEIPDPRFADVDESEDDEVPELEGLTDLKDFQSLSLTNENYDYDQHIRDGGGGVFIPSVELPPEVFGSQLGPRPQMTDEESRELLEDDVLEILEGKIDANEVDELEDDFLQIADEPGENDDGPIEIMPPRAKHPIDPLLLYADMIDNDDDDGRRYDDWADDQPPPRKIVYIPRPKPENENAPLEEVLFEEYGDEEIGELDSDDPDVQGTREVMDTEDALDEFLEEYGGMDLGEVREKLAEDDTQDKESTRRLEKDNDDVMEADKSDDEEDDTFEYVVPDEKVELEWDVESVTTMYSTTENIPRVIGEPLPPRIRIKKGMPVEEEDNRTATTKKGRQMPSDGISVTSSNLGEARRKTESLVEKRERKRLVKEMKRERRMAKKQLKQEYKREEVKQGHAVVHQQEANPAGVRF